MKKQTYNSNMKNDFKKRLYVFTLKLILEFIDKLQKYDNVADKLADQLIRSGTSIIANYVEAQSASSKKDYTNFFNHALKSANESKLWIGLLRGSGRTKNIDTAWFLSELDEFSKILASSILTLKNKR